MEVEALPGEEDLEEEVVAEGLAHEGLEEGVVVLEVEDSSRSVPLRTVCSKQVLKVGREALIRSTPVVEAAPKKGRVCVDWFRTLTDLGCFRLNT